MKISRFIRSFLMLTLGPLLTLLVSVLALVWLTILRRPADSIHGLVRYWGRFLCWLGGIRVELIGLENLEPDRPYIFAANHQSQVDILALQGYLDTNFKWLAKKELFQVPVWGSAMRRAGYIPIDRSHGRQALKSLNEAAKRIAEGTSVIIFPEGTRSRDGRLHPFKAGGMALAIKAGVPLVPTAITGTFEILPKASLLIKPGRVTIRLGQPIETGPYTLKQKQELAQILHDKVEGLLCPENHAG